MASFLLVETRSAGESPEVAAFLATAGHLCDDGHAVDLYLVQNAVLLARRGGSPEVASLLARATVRVFADDYSAEARGLGASSLQDGVALSGMGTLVDLLAGEGVRTLWH